MSMSSIGLVLALAIIAYLVMFFRREILALLVTGAALAMVYGVLEVLVRGNRG
jgi:zinc transporter ZupT